ncbi:MAG: D-alanyl-D-alanine carboxypeptidase family protein [Notoacmeibacter sp.]
MAFKSYGFSARVWQSFCFISAALVLSACTPSDTLNIQKVSPPNAPITEKFAAIVIDANTGRVLYENDANETRFPASLAKMMTVYLMFDQLASGKATLNSPIFFSANAARQPPSKLGIKAGSFLIYDEAIRALSVKSANDVSMAVAETIGGTQANFAAMMTAKARSLGMTRTRFTNPSGLPDSQMVTTARDMAILGLALRKNHGRYYGYWKQTTFDIDDREVRGHNKTLGVIPGADGIKTGYTRASGFNLATSVRYNGRSIVAVVMGEKTAAIRDQRMRSIISQTLPKATAR